MVAQCYDNLDPNILLLESHLFFIPADQALWTCIPLIFMEELKKMKLITVYLLAALQRNTPPTDDVSIAYT